MAYDEMHLKVHHLQIQSIQQGYRLINTFLLLKTLNSFMQVKPKVSQTRDASKLPTDWSPPLSMVYDCPVRAGY